MLFWARTATVAIAIAIGAGGFGPGAWLDTAADVGDDLAMRRNARRWLGAVGVGGGAVVLLFLFLGPLRSGPEPDPQARARRSDPPPSVAPINASPGEAPADPGPGELELASEAATYRVDPRPERRATFPAIAPSGRSGPRDASSLGGHALIGGVFRPAEVERLRERVQESQVMREYLRLREHASTWEQRQALLQLESEVEQELGSHDFDRLLYALGADNRVVISYVIRASAADRAGLAVGDVVVSYDGQPVFKVHALRAMMQKLRDLMPAEPVRISVRRDGRVVDTAIAPIRPLILEARREEP